MDITHNVARGFHNLPKMYGDDTVRPLEKVTDVQSGLQAAGKVSSIHISLHHLCGDTDLQVEFWLWPVGWNVRPRDSTHERRTGRWLHGRPGGLRQGTWWSCF
jgi:hypothetical protein